jgi:RNA ligase (TIGR02306 family)
MVKIVKVDSIASIPGADLIEVASVGGWQVIVKKGEYQEGSLAAYFEIDSFLPEGNPAWQFLVDKSSKMFNGVKGHVLRSLKLRGQISQGLLLPFDVHAHTEDANESNLGTDISGILGVSKYEPPIPAQLAGLARGSFPSCVPKTDQERVQNLSSTLESWKADPDLTWEVTEKLEGSSCTFAWLEGSLHVCSRNIDLKEAEGNSFWQAAADTDILDKLTWHFRDRDLALQGELVGPGIQGNIYGLSKCKFYLFDVFDVKTGRYLRPAERAAVASTLLLEQVPVLLSDFKIPQAQATASILGMADGKSALSLKANREGLVFKCNQAYLSFKAISNNYLLKQSL